MIPTIKQLETVDKANKGKRGIYYFSLKPYGYFFEPSPKHQKFNEKIKTNS